MDPSSQALRVGIVGAAGYTGAELIRLIDAHPYLDLTFVAAKENAGQELGAVLPSLLGTQYESLPIETFDLDQADQVAARLEIAFTALPHAASARLGGALYDRGVQVVDLSADFRLRNSATYEAWYGTHPRPDLLSKAVYGIPELYREPLRGARLIACAGCYPTSAILPLAPLFSAGLIDRTRPIIVDGKSGVSGGGRKPAPAYHLPETAEGMRPYKVGGTHRHTPEIEQELSSAAGSEVRVLFTPQLAPMTRGILTTAYATPQPGVSLERCREVASSAYGKGLVTVLKGSFLPDTLHVRGSARAQIAYALDERSGLLLCMSAIDNLSRGASAQAIQALNAARGWPEDTGLPKMAMFP